MTATRPKSCSRGRSSSSDCSSTSSRSDTALEGRKRHGGNGYGSKKNAGWLLLFFYVGRDMGEIDTFFLDAGRDVGEMDTFF